MIVEFKVKNFLSIKNEQVLSFEATADKTLEDYFTVTKGKHRLLKIALIFGPNASGKTNILMALDFLRKTVLNIPMDKTSATGFIPFLLDENSKNRFGVFDLSFYAGRMFYNYHLEINSDFINNETLTYYPGIRPAVIFNRTYERKKDLTQIDFGSKVKLKTTDKELIRGNTIRNMSVIAAYSKLNIEFPELDGVSKYFLHNMLELVTPKSNLRNWTSNQVEQSLDFKNFIVNLLNNADFNISDIHIETEKKSPDDKLTDLYSMAFENLFLYANKFKEKKLKYIHETKDNKEVALPAELESAGTNRYFGLSGVLFEALKNDKCLLIDEIDSSLHPDLVIHFINTFLANSREAQLVCTTHDLNILSEQDNLRRDIIWFTQKQTDGATELYSLADFKHRKVLSFINAYKAGKFGAKPNLGSVFLKTEE